MLNPKYYGALIKHLVRKGNIVIYPRYQRTLDFLTGIQEFNDTCAKGIKKALDTIQQPGHVKGRIQNYFILGHSVGGVLTANMTMLHAQYGLPKPLAAFSIEPGAANYLLSDYSSFPSDVNYLIAISENDAIVGTAPGTTIFNQTVAVPTAHKNLVHQYGDSHGSPAITATHMDPGAEDAAFDNGESNLFILGAGAGPVTAYDYFCTWKLQDALMDCALHNQNCEYAFGDTPEQHGMGNWSDGTPVRILEITPAAPSAINNLKEEVAVSIYPNPSSDRVQFRVLAKENAKMQLQIFDEMGRTIDTKNFLTPSLSIETGNWNPGVYFYQLKSEIEILKSGKLLVE
jgi:hypothetical protein